MSQRFLGKDTLIDCINFQEVPIISLLMGIYLCLIEFISVRENADIKDKKRQAETNKQILKIVKAFGTEKVKAAIKEYEKSLKEETE